MIVPEKEALMSTYKEEFAQEFGMNHSIVESDTRALNMSKSLLKKSKKEENQK
ncbi:hypothetical protein [Halalkalibacter nanhaiisediminis]|uniref:Uncharacterized protein n=1 Tax=Halalkalibacter nanhaiisediminis TaxID=688079 RepID=A0A562QEM1_9BACI|nr:hypothetical protein [Halalkalibacter nanhaiisediminis]TWI55143.1 hypothetical protein IQ10_02690 [Halalkalibacter nanhaiisediminis]